MTNYSNNNVDGRGRVILPSENEMVGMVSDLLHTMGLGKEKDVGYLERVIREALKHDQVHMFFGEDRDLVGFVVWAKLAKKTEERIFATGNLDLHPSEWNEGESVWIIDLVLLPGRFKFAARVIRDEILVPLRTIRYRRSRVGVVQFKEMDRSHRGAFFTRGAEKNIRKCRCGLPLSQCEMVVT